MYHRCLIAVLLVIILVGCSTPSPEETAQDPNVNPEGVRITPDVVYGHKFGMALTFDLFQPENQNGAGVIWIDSGAWKSGHHSNYKQTIEGLRITTVEELDKNNPPLRFHNIEPLVSKGFTVFDVSHGSSPKFEMMDILNDLRRAVRFIRYNAVEYGVDAERLGLWGVSSGGHLSLLLGTTAHIGNPKATEEFEKDIGRVAAVVAYCPPTDIVGLVDFARKNDLNFLKETPFADLGDDQLIEFSPINFVSSDDPPTLIIHGDRDELVPISEGEMMYKKLLNSGVESKFLTIPGAGHTFVGKDADQAVAEMASWFEKYLVAK